MASPWTSYIRSGALYRLDELWGAPFEVRGQEVELAVNYSKASAALLRSRRIRIDRLKCPAWPTLVREVQAIHPLYVHLPLRVGMGTGEVASVEAPGVPDWAEIENLLALTGTPFVNVHLTPTVGDHPDIPRDTQEPAHVEQVAEAMLKDLRAVVARFGRDRVIAENNPLIVEAASTPRSLLRPAALPQVIRYVVETAGCGLLLDLAHVRLAASGLGMDPRAYLGLLPVDRIRELHVTGVQPLAGHWLDWLHPRASQTTKVVRDSSDWPRYGSAPEKSAIWPL